MNRTTIRVLAGSIAAAVAFAAPAAAQTTTEAPPEEPTATTQVEEPTDTTDPDETTDNADDPTDPVEATTTETTTRSSVTREAEPVAEEPEIRTSAGEREDNLADVGATIVDTVSYSGLTPGETYTLKATTLDAAENADADPEDYLLLPNTGETEFTASKTGEGRVDVEIEITESADELVVFETLLDADGEIVAEHRDIADKSQTVKRSPGGKVSIRTSASLDTDNVIQSGAQVSDQVTYEGLTAGKVYRLESRLMCTEDGEDTGAEKTTEFTADAASGTVTVTAIEVTDPDCMTQTVFQKLYEASSGALVGAHEDINDAAQTVGSGDFGKKKKKKKDVPEAPDLIGKPSPVGTGGPTAPRQVIASVPSGEAPTVGIDLFAR